jgi:hypothetical protein
MAESAPHSLRLVKPLEDGNFNEWLVDVRAHLRLRKLWSIVQDSPEPKSSKERAQWEENSQHAADLMTPTLSTGIKQKLTEPEFNCGHTMLARLRTLLQPSGNIEFMRLSKEYFTLRYHDFKTMSDYLTRIKVLEEKIDSTKVDFNTNRTILCLSMSLPPEYQSLVQIWTVTPSITPDKARSMLLEASRQREDQDESENSSRALRVGRFGKQDKPSQQEYTFCDKRGHLEDRCWKKHPDQRPDWAGNQANKIDVVM